MTQLDEARILSVDGASNKKSMSDMVLQTEEKITTAALANFMLGKLIDAAP